MLLIFASFIVKRWLWLYVFNLSGTILLTIYAIIIGDPVFTVVEAGIALFLGYRLLTELRHAKTHKGNSRGQQIDCPG